MRKNFKFKIKEFIENWKLKIGNSREGFTLIELIVVIGIISVMATAVLAVLNPSAQINKANDARRKADLSQIQKALEIYYQDNGKYPVQGEGNTITDGVWGTNWGNYMNVVPKDPKTSNKYIYVNSNGQTYYLYASLEREIKDPQACTSSGHGTCSSLASNGISATACGGYCNYGVSSADVSP